MKHEQLIDAPIWTLYVGQSVPRVKHLQKVSKCLAVKFFREKRKTLKSKESYRLPWIKKFTKEYDKEHSYVKKKKIDPKGKTNY